VTTSKLGRLFTLLLFVLPYDLIAQTTGDIRGTVTDPSGAVVSGAAVTATLKGEGTERKASSDSSGQYTIPTLPVGSYTVHITATGFKTFEQAEVAVDIGHVAQVDATLQLGQTTEVVTAEASAPLVETTSTQLGAVMNSTSVVNLPLNARDTYQLLQLQPGVQSQRGYDLFAGSEEAGAVSVNGGRGRANNYNVNGGDANDQFLNAPAVQPSPDAIEEFRVLTNTFDAEYGRNSGSVVNVVTKGGTNEFHGNVYEFFRNKALNSRGFFDTELAKFNQNQYGGTLGGPIIKNRTFFFVSAEERQIRQGISSDLVNVPTQSNRAGDLSDSGPFTGTLTDDNVAALLNARPGCASAVQAGGGGPIAAETAWSSIFRTAKSPALVSIRRQMLF
jgi:Carboxypeptidase regulatory-like domain/TonB-dependent Receptor Plug Domain